MNFEYNNEENTWQRRTSSKLDRMTCHQIPKRSTSVAVIVLGLAVLSCLLGYCVLSESAPYDARTLRLAIIVFRHGARTPTSTYNSDPYKNYNWPDGLGSLTNVGKMQLYDLGRKFRSYYGTFLPDEYLEKDLYVMSSDHSRCLMSAYTFLAGLYPPAERQKWHPDIPWQPIPVHSLPRNLDKTIAGKKPCKNADKLYEDLTNQINSQPQYTELFDYLSKQCNQTLRSILKVEFLYSTLRVQHETGLKLPEWTKNVFPHKMHDVAKTSLALFTYNDTMKRLRGGPLLQNIISELSGKVEKTLNPDRSLFLYSSHDVTVVNLWRVLGFEEPLLPDYGASLVLELHEEVEQQEFHVKAFFWNNTKVESPIELRLPFCSEPCTYQSFKDSLTHLIPVDWELECGN